MVDADRKVEMRDGSGGTIEISSNNGNVVIQGSMQYENATVDLEYTGAVTDLSTFNDSEHSGSGKMKWSFETEPMTISATCYKYLRFKEGDMYLIFLYCGEKIIFRWKNGLSTNIRRLSMTKIIMKAY